MNDHVEKHPLALSDAERQASLALIDDDEIGGDGSDGGEAAAGTATDAAAPAAGTTADPAADPEDGEEGAGDGKTAGAAGNPDTIDPETLKAIAADGDGPPMIPKGRFDEVNVQLKGLRSELDSLKSERAAAMAAVGEPRDFASEKAALADRYEEGDLTLAEYLSERDKLVVEEAKFAARVEQAQTQAAAQTAAAQEAWNNKIGAWMKDNSEFLSNSVRRDAWERLLDKYGTDASLTDEQLIEKAQNEAFEAFQFTAGAAKPPAPPANPHAARNAADAAAQSAASAVPSPAAGGMGDRGRNVGVDIMALKPGQFSKLTPEQQRAALGEDE
jgi:hypothetical protein